MSEDINDQGLSRKHTMESIDKSLARLGTDYLDIYFCHRSDRDTPILETAWAMHDLITQGKVLYWGTSEWEPEQLDEAARLCDAYRLHPPRAEQPQYSMLYRERVEKRILPIIRSHGIGLTVYSPLGLGLLTGKYDDGIPEDSRFNREPWAKERNFTEANVEKVKRLKPIADGLGITRTQLALAWALREYGISSVITSATTAAQIKESLGAADVQLDEETLAEIDDILAG
jgi:aryl-alcohol dehydrogenase-like predicted oxidoreductase